jgi:hypothetical protein
MTKYATSGLETKDHAVSLAFAVTDYKLQGRSLDRLIVSLAPREFEPELDITAVYVLLSRVRTRAGLRVLAMPTDWDHLRALRHTPVMTIWEKAYDEVSGMFDAIAASEAAEKLDARFKAEKKTAKEAAAAARAELRPTKARAKAKSAAGPSKEAQQSKAQQSKAQPQSRAASTKQPSAPQPRKRKHSATADKRPHWRIAEQDMAAPDATSALLAAPRDLFLYCANDADHGTLPPALRGCPNALGVRTCSARGIGYRDATFLDNCSNIRHDIGQAVSQVLRGEYDRVVIPSTGLAADEAQWPEAAPRTHLFLLEQLAKLKEMLGGAGAGTKAAAGATSKAPRAPSVAVWSPTQPRKPAPQRSSSTVECNPELQSNKYRANSCHVDAALKMWELGMHAASTVLTLDALFPATVEPAGPPDSGTSPTPADLATPLRAWLQVAQELASATDRGMQRTLLGRLNLHRDEVRATLSRRHALVSLRRRFDGSSTRSYPSEAHVAAEVQRKSNQMGTVSTNVKAFLDSREGVGGTLPQSAYLGGKDAPRRCSSCGRTAGSALSTFERRVHGLSPELIQLHNHDPLSAFAARWATFWAGCVDPCSRCGTQTMVDPGWWSSRCLLPQAPPLLCLEWEVCDLWQVGEPTVQLTDERRDSARLVCPDGEATYRLLALIYYNGGHYITVGRRTPGSSQWICWDDNGPTGGAGVILDSPPCGSGALRGAGGRLSWLNYSPTMALYMRVGAEPPDEL